MARRGLKLKVTGQSERGWQALDLDRGQFFYCNMILAATVPR